MQENPSAVPSGEFRKFFDLTWTDKVLLVRAGLALSYASFLIRFLPFSQVCKFAEGPVRAAELSVADKANIISRVRWAIIIWAGRVPWKAVCFQQGLAAQMMLRHRGIGSTMYYGVAPHTENGLGAHVWVCDGDTYVIGGELAPSFATLATFPPVKGPVVSP
jgi:hypothetical protein